MQKAKAFFFVSAGVFLLVLAYHFGANNAQGQAVTISAAGADAYRGWCTMASGRTVNAILIVDPSHRASMAGVPGTDPIVCCSYDYGTFIVGLANGDVYSAGTSTNIPGWQYVGNNFGATPAAQRTWGQLKATYRK